MTELAEQIKVIREGRHARLFIDGEEFPWYVAENGVAWELANDGMPVVTVQIIANNVMIVDGAPA